MLPNIAVVFLLLLFIAKIESWVDLDLLLGRRICMLAREGKCVNARHGVSVVFSESW